MKLLLATHTFFPKFSAGTEVLALGLARGLRSRGHEVELLTGEADIDVARDEAPWIERTLFDGFTVHRLHFGARNLRDPIPWHTDNPPRVAAVLRLIDEVKPDLVHLFHFLPYSARVIPALRERGIPVLFTPTEFWTVCPKGTLYREHDAQVCDGPETGVPCIQCYKPLPRPLVRGALALAQTPLARLDERLGNARALTERLDRMRASVNAADRILPGTRFLRDVLVRHGIDPVKARVIPHGVDIGPLPDRVPIPAAFTPETPLRIGFVGRLVEVKGAHLLIAALALLGSARSRVHLLLYGKMDPADSYCRLLQETARGCGAPVTFAGTFAPDDIGRVMRGLHLLVLPSIWHENAPLVLESALGAGTPSILSNVEGMTEMIRPGETGEVIPKGDVQSMADRILAFLEEPDRLRRMTTAVSGGHRTATHYTADIEAVYHEVLAAAPIPPPAPVPLRPPNAGAA